MKLKKNDSIIEFDYIQGGFYEVYIWCRFGATTICGYYGR